MLLAGRQDLAKHFAISAAISAHSGAPLADAIGLYKELEDARGGSGFSFDDLAAEPAVVLAVSGGPDSTALLHLMARWRGTLRPAPRLVAVTIDHGLRPEARREAAAVKQLSEKLGVEHVTMRWSGEKPATGIQEAARLAELEGVVVR